MAKDLPVNSAANNFDRNSNMHRHRNTQYIHDELSLIARTGEVYHLPSGKTLDLVRVAADIQSHPNQYTSAEIPLMTLATQIRGRTHLNFHYVATMERDRARRPLLLGLTPDGDMLLLDGRHRAARSLQLGYESASAWLLNPDQIDAFCN